MNILDRIKRLLPRINGELTPRYIRCYDNGGKTADRFTIVFTGNFPERNRRCWVLGCSEKPFHPQGIGIISDNDTVIDYPTYSHLGKKVKYNVLPNDVKWVILDDYKDFWNIPFAYIESDLKTLRK